MHSGKSNPFYGDGEAQGSPRPAMVTAKRPTEVGQENLAFRNFQTATSAGQTVEIELSQYSDNSWVSQTVKGVSQNIARTPPDPSLAFQSNPTGDRPASVSRLVPSVDTQRREHAVLLREVHQKIRIKDFLAELAFADDFMKAREPLQELVAWLRESLDRNFLSVDLEEFSIDRNESEALDLLEQLTGRLRASTDPEAAPLMDMALKLKKQYMTTLGKFQEVETRLAYRNILLENYYRNGFANDLDVSLNYSGQDAVSGLPKSQTTRRTKQSSGGRSVSGTVSLKTIDLSRFITQPASELESTVPLATQVLKSTLYERSEWGMPSATHGTERNSVSSRQRGSSGKDSEADNGFAADSEIDRQFMGKKSATERVSIHRLRDLLRGHFPAKSEDRTEAAQKAQPATPEHAPRVLQFPGRSNCLPMTGIPEEEATPGVVRLKNFYDDLVEELESQVASLMKALTAAEEQLSAERAKHAESVDNLTEQLTRAKIEVADLMMEASVNEMERLKERRRQRWLQLAALPDQALPLPLENPDSNTG